MVKVQASPRMIHQVLRSSSVWFNTEASSANIMSIKICSQQLGPSQPQRSDQVEHKLQSYQQRSHCSCHMLLNVWRCLNFFLKNSNWMNMEGRSQKSKILVLVVGEVWIATFWPTPAGQRQPSIPLQKEPQSLYLCYPTTGFQGPHTIFALSLGRFKCLPPNFVCM